MNVRVTYAGLLADAQRAFPDSDARDDELVWGRLRVLLGLSNAPYSPSTTFVTEDTLTLRGGRILATLPWYYDKKATIDPTTDHVYARGHNGCSLCDTDYWCDLGALDESIAKAVQHLEVVQNGRIVVRDGEFCRGCAKTFAILVSVYMAIRTRPLSGNLLVSSSRVDDDGKLPADCLHTVMRLLPWRDRCSAAAACMAWYQAAHDPLVVDARRDAPDVAAVLLGPPFARMQRFSPCLVLPSWHNLIAAWTLTLHWLREGA
jgi:hypothetical protein